MYKIGTSGPWTLGVEHLYYEYNPYWTGLIKRSSLERFRKPGTHVSQAMIALSSFFYCLAQQLFMLGGYESQLGAVSASVPAPDYSDPRACRAIRGACGCRLKCEQFQVEKKTVAKRQKRQKRQRMSDRLRDWDLAHVSFWTRDLSTL